MSVDPLTAAIIAVCIATFVLIWISVGVLLGYLESRRPPPPSDWRERDFGDHPSVSEILFHSRKD